MVYPEPLVLGEGILLVTFCITRQFLVGDSAASYGHNETIQLLKRMQFDIPFVQTESEFIDIPTEMLIT